jgi:hypothetical protein
MNLNFHTNDDKHQKYAIKAMNAILSDGAEQVSNAMLLEIASSIIRFSIETAIPKDKWIPIFEEYANEVKAMLLAKMMRGE